MMEKSEKRKAIKKHRVRVYICSPYSGAIVRNERRAQLYCREAYDRGFYPIAPHLYFPQFLDDKNESERELGLAWAQELLWKVDELWVCGQSISSGMQVEIELAKQLKMCIRYFTDKMEEKT